MKKHEQEMLGETRGTRQWTAAQAVAGAVAAVAAVAGVVVLLAKDDDTGSPSTTPSALRAVITRQESRNNALVPIAVLDLPTPPRYERKSSPQQQAHCGDWVDWLESQRAASYSPPAMNVSAPAETAVTITSMRVKIHRVERPPAVSMIMCVYGAGGYEPTYVTIDLSRPESPPTLSEDEKGGEIGPIPNAVFTVAPGRTETLELQAHGEPGMLYEWGVDLDVTVNQRTEKVTFGTPQKPLRSWSVDDPPQVDYDPKTQQWRPAPF